MVESFFNKELTDISFEVEALEEWKSIASELGLENQLQLTKGKESPVPYPYMNICMERVYETLCPCKVLYKDYKLTPIPLEVLKQISFSVKDKHFNKIEIWFDDKTPDPIVVGYLGYYYVYDNKYNRLDIKFDTQEEATKYKNDNNLYSTGFELIGKYLIARWGDELKDFKELKKLAIERFIENVGSELKRELATLTEKLKVLTENSTSYILGNINRHEVTGKW